MKKILLLLFIAFLSLGSNAQTTIGNGTMETWLSPTGADAHPTQWSQIKNGVDGCGFCIGFAPQGCYRDATSPHGGTYSGRIVTGSAFGQVANGTITTGRLYVPSTDKNEGYIRSIAGDPNYAMALTARPDSLVFWYKYTPVGTDYPGVNAYMHVGNYYVPEAPFNNNHPDSSSNKIASLFWNGPNSTVSAWTRIAVPFVYTDARTPQYILIIATSSADPAGGNDGSNFWVDDFSLIYNPTIATGTIAPLSYYVSAAVGANVSVPFTLTGTYNSGNTVTAQLSDASGSFASPVAIGSVTATASGTIAATIPANTATGTGYRIRVVSNSPGLTAANNGSDISITLVSNSIAPGTAQTIAANTNGTQLSITETPAAISREWRYSTTSGSGYVSFAPGQTSASYTPNFATAGTYYIVSTSSFTGGLTVTSNEVMVTVVSSSIAPASTQSILVGVNGTTLTVTESPVGSWREWLYSTTSGSGYVSFIPAITGATTYTPNFAVAGNYYVVCQSIINGVTLFSNEVLISVGNATIATGAVSGSPFYFSPSAPDAGVNVPFTTSGTFNSGNIFKAQLSDASGSFNSAVDIGTLTATSSGTITASIPHTTPGGTGYRVRVISDDPIVLGSDNGTDLAVDQFNNSIAPATSQTMLHGTNGLPLTVTASQTSTQEWKYTTTSGSGYVSFAPAETASSYTPNFPTPGTYYVVAVSANTYSDEVVSNEVQVNVDNGTTISTSAISGSPFLISASMPAAVSVNFTSDVIFNSGNIFKAQLSDNTGSFASAVEIGTLAGATIATIPASIPVSTAAGVGYRIRVVSTDPAITGSDNSGNLEVIPFATSVAPTDTQHILAAQNGNAITVTETHVATRVWKYSQTSGAGYAAFAPNETGVSLTPNFNTAGTYYVVVESTNSATDKLTAQEVVVIVTPVSGIDGIEAGSIKAYWTGNDFIADITSANLSMPVLELLNVNGQLVMKRDLNAASINRVTTSLAEGVYLFRIIDGEKIYTGKSSKK